MDTELNVNTKSEFKNRKQFRMMAATHELLKEYCSGMPRGAMMFVVHEAVSEYVKNRKSASPMVSDMPLAQGLEPASQL